MNGCAHMVQIIDDEGTYTCQRCGKFLGHGGLITYIAPAPPPPSEEPEPAQAVEIVNIIQRPRCVARTQIGKPCVNDAIPESGELRLCGMHLNSIERVPTESRPTPRRRREREPCAARTLAGEPCKRRATTGRYCSLHTYAAYTDTLGSLDTRPLSRPRPVDDDWD